MNKYIIVSKELRLSFILKKQNPKIFRMNLEHKNILTSSSLKKKTLHLAEQATDFSPAKYTASDLSLVWLIAESCLTFPGSDFSRNPRLEASWR